MTTKRDVDPLQRGKVRDADDLYPPVSPPDASFLMQLFITPMLIVAAVVGAWFGIAWLATPVQDAGQLVNGIERMDHRSWQKALSLANYLRDPRSTALRADATLAERLAELLESRLPLKTVSVDEERLQIYLCRALGEFETSTPLATLARAAEFAPGRPTAVQRGALQAIGLILSRTRDGIEPVEPQILDVLLKMLDTPLDTLLSARGSSHPEGSLGSGRDGLSRQNRQQELQRRLELQRLQRTAVFVLGFIEADRGRERLRELIQAGDADLRDNATVSLARLGDQACREPLLEMLTRAADQYDVSSIQPEAGSHREPGSMPEEEQKKALVQWKREQVLSAALQAVALLKKDFPNVDLQTLAPPLRALADDRTLSQEIRLMAREVNQLLQPVKM